MDDLQGRYLKDLTQVENGANIDLNRYDSLSFKTVTSVPKKVTEQLLFDQQCLLLSQENSAPSNSSELSANDKCGQFHKSKRDVMERIGAGSSSSDLDSELGLANVFHKATPKRKKKTLKLRVPIGPENEIFWWPKDSVDRNVDRTEGSNLSSSLSTVYCSTCDSDPIECDYKRYSSSWSAEELQSIVPEVEESGSELVTPNSISKEIKVNKSSWEDLRISSPEYEEEDYLLQLNYGYDAPPESLNDLISSNVIDKIKPEGEEYQIVFISSSSSTKSSDFNDFALEEFSVDSDCEVDKLDFIGDFGCDEKSIQLSKHKHSQLDDDPPPLPSVPPPFPQLINESFKFYKSPSPTDFFMLENYGARSIELDVSESVTEWKSADILVTDDEDVSVNDNSSVYSFARTDSVRSSGERSISEQCFSNQVFSSGGNHLLVINISENCDLNDLLGMSEMSEQEMTFTDDDEEDNFQLSVSFDSGTSVSDGEVNGGGHVEEGLDSSDEECVAWSYDIASQCLDQGQSENGDNTKLLEIEKVLENGELMMCDVKDEQVTVIETLLIAESSSEIEIPLVAESVSKIVTPLVAESVSEIETPLVAESVSEIETPLVAELVSEFETPLVAESVSEFETPLVAESISEIETPLVAESISEIETQLQAESITEAEASSVSELINEAEIITTADIINEIPSSVELIGATKQLFDDAQSVRDSNSIKIDVGEEIEAINDEVVVIDDSINISIDLKSEEIEQLYKVVSIKNCNEILQPTIVLESESEFQLQLESPSGCEESVLVGENQAVVISDEVYESIHDEINSELDKSDTDSQDTVIEGETYKRMRQVAIREKLLLANREWEDEKSDNTPNESPVLIDQVGGNQDKEEKNIDTSPPVVNLHELIAKSRAMSASYKQNSEIDDNVNDLSTARNASSVFEKYFTTSLEQMAPLELDRNRFRQPTLIKASGEECEKDDNMEEEIANSDVSSVKSSEDASEIYDSDRRFEDSSTEGDETFDEDDNDTSSTISTSSDEGSMFLRPMRPGEFSSNEEAMLMCRQTLDMSLHTIMEESCEESESEERRKPTNLRRSDPSELQRYFEFTFAGSGMPENYFLEKQAAGPSNLSNVTSNSTPAVYQPFMPGDRMSRTDSELSYDTMSETDGSIYSENENRDELMDDEELARLASSRLEKYFLTGMLGMNVGNFLTNDNPTSQNALPASNKDGSASISAANQSQNKIEIHKNRTESLTDSSNEEDESSLGAFEQSEGCNTIKRIKPKVDKQITTLEESVNKSIISYLKGVSAEADSEIKNEQYADKSEASSFVVKGDVKVDTNVPLTMPWSPAMGGVTRSLVALDWKQQSRDSGFIGSSDDLLQEDNVENSVNKNLTITEEISQTDSICETPIAETPAIKENLINEGSNLNKLEVDEAKMDQFPVMTSSSVGTTNFGLFRSSSKSTKSGRSVNLYTSDDEAQYIVNQLVNHITKSMTRSPQLVRAKPPAIEAFESELTKLMQTVPAIEFTVKEIVEELSSTDHYSDSYESSDYTSSDQEGPISEIGGPLLPFQLPAVSNKTNFGVNLERNDSGRSWRSFGSTGSKNSSIQDGSDEVMSEETIFIYEKFMNSLTKMAEHMSEDAKSGIGATMDEKTRIGANYSGKNSTPSSGKGSPPTAVRIVQHIRSKLTSLMREVQIERSPSNGSSRSSFRAHIRPTITWNKPSSGCGSVAGDEISISSTTSSVNFDSEDSPTDTELSMDSDDISIPNLKNDLVTLTNYTKVNNSSVSSSLSSSAFSKSGSTNSILQSQSNSTYAKNTRKGDHLTSSGRPLSLMEKTTTDDDDESEDGLERWSSDMTIVDDDVRFTSVHKSEPMLLSHSGTSDTAISKRLATSQLYSLSSHPDPTSQTSLSRGSMGSLLGVGSSGSSTCSIPGGAHGNNSCKSDWDMWKSISKGGQTSNQKHMPTKYKSCDPLPSAKSTTKSTNITSTTPRDKKKHAFAFIMKQKSGSSASLRDTSTNQETVSIKQQIQFRSSLHLSNVKSSGEPPQPQSQQHRSSSMQWLFGRNRDNSKKGNLPASVGGGGWSSNPDGISRVGVDVTNAVGIELSDSESSSGESKSRRRGSLNVASSNYNVSPSHLPIPHTISQFPSSSSGNINSASTGKASTLPRTFTTTSSSGGEGAAGNDGYLQANISFLHQSNKYLPSTVNTLPISFSSKYLANHESRNSQEQRHFSARSSMASKHKSKSVTNVGAGSNEHSSVKGFSPITGHFKITRNVSGSLSSFSKKSKNHSTESPANRRNASSLSDDLGNVTKLSGKGQPVISNHRRNFHIGDHKNIINISDDSSDIGSRIGNHAGNSDLENYPEEDIDRFVSMHNRSLSSLGVCSESMSSVYSAAGGGHYGHVAVRGEVQFGLSYNYMTGALEVHIKQCRDLAAVDNKRNRSDPYVKVYLLPDKTKSGKRKTRVKKHTLNPIFNEVLKFCVTISDLETRTLWVTVWHSDMFGRNEFLGEVTIPMGYEAWEDTSLKWYSLQEKLGSPEEVYSYKGDLIISLKYEPAEAKSSKKTKYSKGSLYVVVKEARNLMAVASNGTSDPFCKSYLLPDKGKGNKKKTNVIKRTCNPKWNHTFVYEDLSLEEVGERCLELTIWDYDRLTSNDFLGGIRLSIGADKHKGKRVDWMDSRGEEVTLWQSMLEKPNTWVEGSVLLRPTMDHRQTTW